nr:hypothetical protein CFP56_16908 [Quercus suber]
MSMKQETKGSRPARHGRWTAERGRQRQAMDGGRTRSRVRDRTEKKSEAVRLVESGNGCRLLNALSRSRLCVVNPPTAAASVRAFFSCVRPRLETAAGRCSLAPDAIQATGGEQMGRMWDQRNVRGTRARKHCEGS